MQNFEPTAEFAAKLDRGDALAGYRDHFHLPVNAEGKPLIYLCGNSLGLQPRSARETVMAELNDWAGLGVKGHFEAETPWLPYHEFLAEQTASLVGAKAAEVVNMNTLTVNLHLMMVSFYRPTSSRFKILMEANAFPSDQYAVQSQLQWHGYDPREGIIELQPRPGEHTLRTEDIVATIRQRGDEIALILIGGVNYYTGQAFDMAQITEAGHAHGCVVGFDLAHAAGNIELHLHDWQTDFAVWCTYKYLNGGPGAIAACFVHERHAQRPDLPRLAGWWGQSKEIRFQMGPEFKVLPGAEGWQISNPPILSLAPVRASLEIFREAGMAKLRQKSERLTGYLETLLRNADLPGLDILTPRDSRQRGAQLSLMAKKQGRKLYECLTKRDVVCDWREPGVIRIAPVPLYSTFRDVYRFVEVLSEEYRPG